MIENMKNKVELKKTILSSIFIIILFSIMLGLLKYCEYQVYTKNFNHKMASILATVKKEYPEMDNNELIQILNNENEEDIKWFKNYGIDIKKEAIVLQNEKYAIIFTIVSLVLLILLGSMVLFRFLKYNYAKDKTLSEITQYIEEINRKNYKLDIEHNTEDELSILKNEIYKTTIMLKEVAENEIKDKANLKDSLSDISHQLKTPLASITIMLDNILENQEMDANIRNEFIKDIKREIINLNFLVNSLLKLSKLDVNSVDFFSKEELVSDIIEKSIKNLSTLCDLKNIQIRKKGNEKIKIYCDLRWQVEAITNILKNCVEHSNQNSFIDISYEQNKIYTKIEIKDEGIGIEKEDLPHIFERFYKGKNAKSESIGIGLALAKAIISKDNGYIEAESEAGEGTKFIVKYCT